MEQSKFYQIKKVTEHEYTLVGCDGNIITRSIQKVDKSASAFTIEDSKDGDVLVNGSNIFIFSHISGTRSMGYCHINIDNGRFYDDVGRNECFGLIDAVFTPATKEQHDTLFAKMKEAGYEWDAEKKELKKAIKAVIPKEGNYYMCIKNYQFCEHDYATFEQGKLYKSEKDEELTDATGGKWPFGDAKDYFRVATHEEIASIQKPTNKEYTFKAIPRLLEMIEPNDRAKTYCQKLIDDLTQEGYATDAKIVGECLKQMNGKKVAMATMDEQKATKWSEEDERIRTCLIKDQEKGLEDVKKDKYGHSEIISDLKEMYRERISWLKSLRPHNWKPSNEQIKVLDEVIRNPHLSTAEYNGLIEFMEQLKKLKG